LDPEQLLEMNARFVAALEQAFELGLERRASAASQVNLPAARAGRARGRVMGLSPRQGPDSRGPKCAIYPHAWSRSTLHGPQFFALCKLDILKLAPPLGNNHGSETWRKLLSPARRAQTSNFGSFPAHKGRL